MASKVVIVIETDNDAFQGGNFEEEVSRLLESISERISDKPGLALNLHDLNGNFCGTAHVV